MYASFFGLKHLPFSIAPDPRFLYMSDKHREALALLNFGLTRGASFVLLTGEIGAGKTTVMAMLIAWQTINAVRRENSKTFTRGFLIVAPGLTIKDRLNVLEPNHPENYYSTRELVPVDLLGDLQRAKIVITNYHSFK